MSAVPQRPSALRTLCWAHRNLRWRACVALDRPSNRFTTHDAQVPSTPGLWSVPPGLRVGLRTLSARTAVTAQPAGAPLIRGCQQAHEACTVAKRGPPYP